MRLNAIRPVGSMYREKIVSCTREEAINAWPNVEVPMTAVENWAIDEQESFPEAGCHQSRGSDRHKGDVQCDEWACPEVGIASGSAQYCSASLVSRQTAGDRAMLRRDVLDGMVKLVVVKSRSGKFEPLDAMLWQTVACRSLAIRLQSQRAEGCDAAMPVASAVVHIAERVLPMPSSLVLALGFECFLLDRPLPSLELAQSGAEAAGSERLGCMHSLPPPVIQTFPNWVA